METTAQARLAGKFFELQNNELFQEAQEGIMGGALAGLGLMGTDTPAPQIALQTLGAMLGGIGIGMLGKHVGAYLGKKIHPQALKNQNGVLAMAGRLGGQKTLVGGAAETMRYGKSAIKQELMEKTSSQLMNEALQNPQGFANKYGIDAEVFKQHAPVVQQGGRIQAAVETYGALSPEERSALKEQIQTKLKGSYGQVEQLIASQAAGSLDENIAKMAQLTKGENLPGTDMDLGEMFQSLLKPDQDITGEHVGRAAGRFIGDEIGVIGGMTLGGAAAGALGIKNEKDKKIEELQRQLARPY